MHACMRIERKRPTLSTAWFFHNPNNQQCGSASHPPTHPQTDSRGAQLLLGSLCCAAISRILVVSQALVSHMKDITGFGSLELRGSEKQRFQLGCCCTSIAAAIIRGVATTCFPLPLFRPFLSFVAAFTIVTAAGTITVTIALLFPSSFAFAMIHRATIFVVR